MRPAMRTTPTMPSKSTRRPNLKHSKHVAARMKMPAAKTLDVGPEPEPAHDQIAEVAYLLHLDGIPGTPDDHWREARAKLIAA